MGEIQVKTVSCSIKTICLKPNSTLIFRQCLPHQGMAYQKANIRFFSYMNMKSLRKPKKDETVKIIAHPQQHITIKKLEFAGAFIPENKSNIKQPLRRSKRLMK